MQKRHFIDKTATRKILKISIKSFFNRGRFINEMSFGPILFSQNYPVNPVGETKVRSFCLFRYSSFVLLCIALISLSLGNFVVVFFFCRGWGLDIAVLVDYFQAVRLFLVFSFLIEFFPKLSTCVIFFDSQIASSV